MQRIIAMDIGGTHIRIATFENTLEPIYFEVLPQESIFDGTNALQAMTGFINGYIERHGFVGNVDAVSIGFPATLSKDRRLVLQAPNICGLDGFSINELASVLNLRVCADKDVVMLMHYDMHTLNIPAMGMSIGYYVGTGLGNIIMIDGAPVTGFEGVAGEIGHIHLPGHVLPCGCGNIGCLENYAAGKALVRICKTELNNAPIHQIFIDHKNHPAVKQYIDYLAVAITIEINILNPDHIILGGGVLSMNAFPKEELENRIRAYTRKPLPAENLHILYSQEGEHNGVIGAALYARKMKTG